ncbi:histone-lysine N-methyltransferase 2D-like [Anopheles cruzii]|uniref:histone-lysine N-methyltransferase 2D-like n=1 Tax=Anopheles cruzii TaxID=68878 RepID=UPI0022EC4829|nr:histone-lysine N-methyltransferase 2D-like [Anopheles cruzii]
MMSEAIATLAVLHGTVDSKNATSPVNAAKDSATSKGTTVTTTKARQTPTKPVTTTTTTVATKKPSGSRGTPRTSTTAKQAGSDREARGKRTLEFGNFGSTNYNYPGSPIAQRRVSYQDPGQYSHFQGNYIQPQYSYQQQHPQAQGSLGSYQGFDAQLDGSNSIGSFQSLGPAVHHQHYVEPPEPIIEIIIQDGNETVPQADPHTFFRQHKKKKEEVQVFYVKYHKDEKNGQLVLDDPLPAIKPIPDESEEEEDPSQEPFVVTPGPPLKTTTLRAIINPDSEKYHSNSGIRISFGVNDKHQTGHQLSESESESVAQPVVALPHPGDQRSKSDVFYQQHQQFVQGQAQQDRSVRQQYPHPAPPAAPQPPPPAHHHHQFAPQHYHHHYQAQPLVQQPEPYRFGPATPAPYRAQPAPPPQQQQQQQQHYQQPYQPQQQYQAPQPPQPQRVVYSQPPPQPQPQQQFQFRGQFQPQQQLPPQPHYFQQQAPVPQPRPQQVRFPPQQPQQPQQAYYQPQPPQAQPQPLQQQPQFQRQEYQQQPKPIPIPLHNINQQPPLRPQYSPQPQQQPQQQQQQQQFNQPFNNFHRQPTSQPQQQPQPQPSFRKPPPPPPPPPATVEQPPFVSAPRPQSPAVRGNFYETARPVQGGLVQQAAPNLGPTRAPEREHAPPARTAAPSYSGLSDSEHLSNLKHVLPAGGELVASVSKYEKHITETINGPGPVEQRPRQQPQQPFGQQYYNILPSQELISHSAEPTIETVPAAKKNIGPLASSIGHLPTPQRYVSQQAAQIIPNSEPLNYAPEPRFRGGGGEAVSTQPTVATSRTTYSPTFSTTPRYQTPTTPTPTTTTARPQPPSTPRSVAEEAEANEKKQKALFDLPDEVPEDLRQQLLSSGILENADISVLDYDKLGETALENLPPEHLANFFNAGGGAQLAGSSNVLSVVSPNGDKLAEKFVTKNYDVKGKADERDRYEIAQPDGGAGDDNDAGGSEEPTIVTMPERQHVDLKVVRFDSSNPKNVTDRYIKPESTILPSVVTANEQPERERDEGSAPPSAAEQIFNRYLPLKINGAQFPIPDVVELRGRRIASVVVLAPVDSAPATASEETGGFLINTEDGSSSSSSSSDEQQSRFERDVLLDSKRIKFIAGEALKQLIKKPSRDNFRRWLEREGKTDVDLQSVVLLVTRNADNEQEIFMYDIATKGVTHLSGELSSAFVRVAEENAQTQNLDEVPIVDSGIVEQMEPKSATSASSSSVEYGASGPATSSEEQDDEEAEASERDAIYVYPENYRGGLEVNSGYSNIKK